MTEQQLKNRIRAQARRIRSGMSKEMRKRLDRQLCEQIWALPVVQAAQTIALYRSLADEVSIDGLFELFWEAGKRCVVPRVLPARQLAMLEVRDLKADFSPGFQQIQEPNANCPEVAPGEIDVVLVPGTCFTPEGHRLGMGVGYYDRYMSRPEFSSLKIGVAYTFQVLKTLPQEPHDLMMDMVVTDSTVIDCRQGL